MKKILITFLAMYFSIIGSIAASAHAQLTSSVPSKNQVVKVLPALVWIEFDGDLIAFGGKVINKVTVTNSKKTRVDIGGTIVGGARVSTRLKQGLSAGRYLVSYRIVSEDGHPVEGSYYFTYQPATVISKTELPK
jgi:methionine-rich copper-binding protein CopC